MTALREELHQIIDRLPEAELGLVMDYVRTHAHTVTSDRPESPVWDGPAFIGAFASGRDDVSERDEELLFAEHPVDGTAAK
jgi:hypothetical protein